VLGTSTAGIILEKSLEYFNKQLETQGSPIRFVVDISHFSMRIAKKKNGKPNTDYPSIYLTTI
jgi:hypothetical protein